MDDGNDRHLLFVAVHAGAGYHSADKEPDYKMICKKACMQAMAVLNEKKSASEAATRAVSVLEDADLTNAGRGSSLTMAGTVECDASLMDGSSSLFGAVGCISGVVNPVKIAHQLLVRQRDSCLSHGRIPPSVLVGDGARQWAEHQGFAVSEHHKLVTEKTKQLHNKYKRRIERDQSHDSKKVKVDNDDIFENGASPHTGQIQSTKEVQAPAEDTSSVHDTVGAVCVDCDGHIAAAASSGGIWLKQPGRLGPAAMYGAGCWAQDPNSGNPGIAVITSGCGEHIMRTLLAKTCAEHVKTADNASQGLSSCFQSQFLASNFLRNIESKLGGAVALKKTEIDGVSEVELVWGHTTESMAVGYMSGNNHKPKTLISRLAGGCLPGTSFTMSGAHFSTPVKQDQTDRIQHE
ncbi:hypothetical protein BaRGS_00003157 [Batillaria attramentaria]|uniref:Threonine aspartase n=1 Tax=Batillaria attramentaria TaxID=370345 RepID=A0ABD0M149_9CAEN